MRHESSCWAAALFLLSAVGCNRGPAAPELSDSPVYRNAAEGFRFLVPEGWTQTASSMLPPGELDGEIFLVRYNLSPPETGAMLQILCLDETKSAELAAHHAEASFGVARWQVEQPRRTIAINGVEAQRMVYKGLTNDREMTKHVTCFHHNHREYSFVGLYSSNDEKAGQQIERATQSVIWDD